MLNSNLTKTDLVLDLEKIEHGKLLDAIDVINTEISYANDDEAFAKKPIRQNKKILAELHHILNIENYKNSEFRKNLLLHIQPVSKQIEFLQTVLIIEITSSHIKPPGSGVPVAGIMLESKLSTSKVI